MAEISNRAVATAAGGAMLAVALAFVGSADAQEYDRAVRCIDRGAAVDYQSLRLSADRRTVRWRNAGAERSTPLT